MERGVTPEMLIDADDLHRGELGGIVDEYSLPFGPDRGIAMLRR